MHIVKIVLMRVTLIGWSVALKYWICLCQKTFQTFGISSFLCLIGAAQAQAESAGIQRLISDLASCHPQLLAAASKVESAKVAIDETKSSRLPTFSVSTGSFLVDNGSEDTQTSLMATMPVITFGRQEARESISSAELQLSAKEYSKTVADHVEGLIDAWGRRDAIRQRLDIYDQSLSEKQKFVDIIRKRADAGISSDADRRDAKSEYVSDVTQTENLRLQLLDVEAEITLNSCENAQIERVVWENLPKEASELNPNDHPDFGVLNSQLNVAELKVRLTEVNDYPSLDLEAKTTLNSGQDTTSRIGLSLNYEYKTFGRGRSTSIEKANLRVVELKNSLRFLTIDVEQELVANLKRIAQIKEQVLPAIQNEYLNYEDSLASSRRRYDAGRISVREVLSDINSVKQAKLDLLESQQKLSSLYNKIAYSLGVYDK